MYDFHLKQKRFPTTELLLQELMDDIGFKGGKSSLQSVLENVGLWWRKTPNNRKVFIENEAIREKRITHLKLLRRYREENRPIIYVVES